MLQKIGYLYLSASIIAGGFLDQQIDNTSNYEHEKLRAKKLLRIVSNVEDLSYELREFVIESVEHELHKWWRDSRYNVVVDAIIKKIMILTERELIAHNKRIVSKNNHSIITENLLFNELNDILRAVNKIYPGLIAYYESLNDQGPQ
jgi:hypothetical protein